MGRSRCYDKNGMNKGPWTPDEDHKLLHYIHNHGDGKWRTLPMNAGLKRCGKSCRLRWTNYLRPGIKRGKFSFEEEDMIIQLHSILGNKWSLIAARLPGRTDNEIKNYWNAHIRKKLIQSGIDPITHTPFADLVNVSSILNSSQIHMSRLFGLHPLANEQLFIEQVQPFQHKTDIVDWTQSSVSFADEAQLIENNNASFGSTNFGSQLFQQNEGQMASSLTNVGFESSSLPSENYNHNFGFGFSSTHSSTPYDFEFNL